MSTDLIDCQAALLAVRLRISDALTDLHRALAGAYETESNVLGGGLKRVTSTDHIEDAVEVLSAVIEEMTDKYNEEEGD